MLQMAYFILRYFLGQNFQFTKSYRMAQKLGS